MGFEPTTTGITIQDSTVELQPPSKKLACPAGLEPATPSLEGWCSIQLSYGQIASLCRAVVGVERFELPTSCSQSRRATRLRYTPRGADSSTALHALSSMTTPFFLLQQQPSQAGVAALADEATTIRSAGSTAANVLPLPISDCTSRCPPWRSNTCLTIASPSPVPPVSRERLLSTR